MGSCARVACGAASSAAAATIDGRVRARLIGSPVQGGIEMAIMETARLDGKAAALAPNSSRTRARTAPSRQRAQEVDLTTRFKGVVGALALRSPGTQVGF